MKNFLNYAYKNLNVPKKICTHMFGRHHNPKHRITVGAGIMILGVCISHSSEIFFIKVVYETVGFLLHCIGGIPIVEAIQRYGESDGKADADSNEDDEPDVDD